MSDAYLAGQVLGVLLLVGVGYWLLKKGWGKRKK
jgi:flagellar biogenesis protein FliO